MRASRRVCTRALAAALVVLAWGAQAAPPDAAAPAPLLAGYGAEAIAVRAYTAVRLGYYGGAASCAEAPFVSYARSDVEPNVVDAWYVAYQAGADAALLALGAAEYACPMDKALAYLERLWDPVDGGYAPRADLDGLAPSSAEKFADDHALIGLTYLDAAAATPDAAAGARYVALARRVASYLLETYWDDTFGGGFWWSTRRAAVREGKPAQANALAAALFLRLGALNGDPECWSWAERTLAWLDGTLWDEGAGLYRWAAHYADPAAQAGLAISPHYFNYDQGLVIESLLLRHQAGDRGALPRVGEAGGGDLARAQRIAAALDDAFWDGRRPGYSLRSGVVWIYPVFAAWLTPPLLALYAVDGDPRWLEMARRNVDALAASMRDPTDGGYYDYAWDCTRWTTRRDRCPPSGWVMSAAKPTVAQAAVQRALAALALATVPRGPDSGGASP